MVNLRLLAVLPCLLGVVHAQSVGVPTDSLEKLSVEELFRLQVTSVGRKAQELSKAPAAVFVLTADDIRRSGATSIPEALQWVPGLTVLPVDGRSWVISARGDGRLYADKILVMIDGRSLYTPLFSGVLWDSLDLPMEEIDRIEVVRGPGAVMWGPNAVNGVINIITLKARSSTGGQASVASGNAMPGSAEVRWGAAPREGVSYRVWGKADYLTPANGSAGNYFLLDQVPYQGGPVADMDEGSARVGFRLDGESAGQRDQWMIQGDLYKIGRHDQLGYGVVVPDVVEPGQSHSGYDGGYLQARWVRTSADGRESALQFSYDRTNVNYPYAGGLLQNLTFDYQNRRPWGERNEIYWGAGFQQYWDDTYFHRYEGFLPAKSTFRSGDVVLRDEYQLEPGRWMLSLGARVDTNSYRQVEYQPSARLLFTPDLRQSAWLAVSRAVRTPDRIDRDLQYDGGSISIDDMLIRSPTYGRQGMHSEAARSAEAGYRRQSGQHWSVDGSAFWTYYDRLRATAGAQEMTLDELGRLNWPFYECNCGRGRSYGAEVWATWQVTPGWRLMPSYSYIHSAKWLPDQNSTMYVWDASVADIPHQALLRSQHDLSRNWKFDWMARVLSRNRSWDLPGTLLLDAHVSWRLSRSSEFSLGLVNITGRHVLQSYTEAATPSLPLRRTFVIRWTQKF